MALDVSWMNNVHNFYMTTYADRTNSPYDTHKKSELRGVYNSIVKLNKDTPLYILDTSPESQRFAVDMKENARHLKNTIASLGGMDEETVLGKKTAYSSNEALASAVFIGEYDEKQPVAEFELEVQELAQTQMNRGRFLPGKEETGLTPDTYSFDLGINDLNYEFQFNIREGDTNLDLQERLMRLINHSNIGIKASVEEEQEGSGRYALRLESDATGLKNGSNVLFTVSDERTSKTAGAVAYLGIDEMTRGSSNAAFSINGVPRSASSNHFTVGQMYELTLNGVSAGEGDTTQIGLKTDVESLGENLSTLIRGYNDFVRAAAQYSASHPRSGRLVSEMTGLTRHYAEGLTGAGVNLNLDGTLELDEDRFKSGASETDGLKEGMAAIRNFTQSLLRKTGEISLNPMNYVDKTIVAYKNPGHSFASPYITSAYSGMMFNSYC